MEGEIKDWLVVPAALFGVVVIALVGSLFEKLFLDAANSTKSTRSAMKQVNSGVWQVSGWLSQECNSENDKEFFFLFFFFLKFFENDL